MITQANYRYRGRLRPGWGSALFAELMDIPYRDLLERNLPERLVRLVARLADCEAQEREAAALPA